MTERILVTGGSGYLGSVLVGELLGRGQAVRVLDSMLHADGSSSTAAHVSDRLEVIAADIRDRGALAAALADVAAVVHLAAIVGDPACAREPEAAREVNLDATVALLGAAEAAGVGRVVFASTCSNYGRIESETLATEDFPLGPISLYAETKVAAETHVVDRGRPGFCTTCLRFATLYGSSPRMRFDLTVNEFTREVALGRELVVYGETFWRPYVHVRDAARAVAMTLDAPTSAVAGEVFNVGDTRENYRKEDIVGLLRQRFPDARVRYVAQADDPRNYRVSFEKVRARLGFSATRSVAEGIEEVAGSLLDGTIPDPDATVYRN